jgi:hypothetical protein
MKQAWSSTHQCVFAETTVESLGHKVPATGVEPLRSHMQAVLAHPKPSNIREFQAFLGTVYFYRWFLPEVARIVKPLTDLLIGCPKGTELVSLADPQRAAFVAAKDALAAATCMAHPSQCRPLVSSPCPATCRRCSLTPSRATSASCKLSWCAADFSLLNLPKGKSLGRSIPATNSYAQALQHTMRNVSTISKPY